MEFQITELKGSEICWYKGIYLWIVQLMFIKVSLIVTDPLMVFCCSRRETLGAENIFETKSGFVLLLRP